MKKSIVALVAALTLTLSGCESPGPKYRQANSYSEGLAAVQAPNGRWGFVNTNQQWVIPPRFEEVKDFKGGKAPAKMNGRWGFINRQGAWQ